MDQQELWHDSFEDALRVACEAVGPKKVAGEMWPEKPIKQAVDLLWHSLNPERNEKLSASQVALIIKRGRQKGCHAPMYFLAAECHYQDPQPIEPEDERARLQREYIQAAKSMKQISERMEKLAGVAE